MTAAATLKSNAIAVTKGRALLGAGAGQMSRVDATEQALKKAGDETQGAFLGSDAFFPFDDSVRPAAAAGIVAVIQPGGSKFTRVPSLPPATPLAAVVPMASSKGQ